MKSRLGKLLTQNVLVKKISPHHAAWGLLLAVGVALFFRNSQDFHEAFGRVPQDFQVYLRAAKNIRLGISPYVFSESLPYKYSPGLLVPLLLLPTAPWKAWIVFKFLLVLSWCLSITLGVRFKKWEQLALLVVGLLLSWKGVIEALDFGQIEFILLFAAVIAARSLPKHPVFCGLILGILPWVKLPWGFMAIPFGCLVAESGAVAWLAGCVAGTLLMTAALPLAAFGWTRTVSLYHDWAEIVRIQPKDVYLRDFNQSIWGTVGRLVSAGPALKAISFMLLIGVVAVTTGLALRTYRARKSLRNNPTPLAWLTPWLILNHLINPLGWRWASLLLVGAPFAKTPREWKAYWPLLLGVGVVFALQQNPVVKMLGFTHWTDLHPYGLVTIYWALVFVGSAKKA